MSTAKGVIKGVVSIPYYPELAKCLGVCEALIIQQVHWCANTNKNYAAGYLWAYNSVSQWEKLLFMSRSTVKRALSHLEEAQILITGVFNPKKYDKTKWYRVNYERLLLALKEFYSDEYVVDLDLLGMSNLNLPPVQFEPIHRSKSDQPIPIEVHKITTIEKLVASQPNQTEFQELEELTGGAEMLPKNGLKKGPTNVQDTLEKLATPSSEKKQSRIMVLYKLWAVTVPKHHEEVKFVGKFTRKQEAQLLMLDKEWSNSENVLTYLLEKWVKFGKVVSEQTGMKSYPSVPNLDFLVKYKGIAMSFYLSSGCGVVEKKQVLVKPNAINCTEEPKKVPVVLPVVSSKATKTLVFGKKSGTVAEVSEQQKEALKLQLLKEVLKG